MVTQWADFNFSIARFDRGFYLIYRFVQAERFEAAETIAPTIEIDVGCVLLHDFRILRVEDCPGAVAAVRGFLFTKQPRLVYPAQVKVRLSA